MFFRPAYIGLLKFGLETGMLSPTATVLDAAPALDYVGYGDLPNLSLNENAQVVDAVGTPFGVDEVYGDRDVSFRINLKLGRLDFLRYLVRTAGIAPNYYGMPVLALAGGAANNFAGTGFTWLARYCVCNSFTLKFSEPSNTPVSLEADFICLTLDEAAALQTVNEAALITSGGSVLTWAHSDFVVGATKYRHFLGGATISVQNNAKPIGRRIERGVEDPLSRIAVEILPGDEKLRVSYNLHDKLPSTLRGRWAATKLIAGNGSKKLTTTIGSSVLSSQSLNQAQVGNPFGFSAETTSRLLSFNIE